MKKKSRVFVYILIVSLIITVGWTFSAAVSAEGLKRQVTMSISVPYPHQVSVGNTFTVTLGFTPKAPTRKFDFRISYDNTIIQPTSFLNISSIPGTIVAREYSSSNQSQNISLHGEVEDIPLTMVQDAVRITFKATKEGSTIIKVIVAADGDYNTISSYPSPLTINITQQKTVPSTTTLSTTTKPSAPPNPTVTATKPVVTMTTTPSSTSTPSTTPLTTPSVTPITTEPEEIPDTVVWTGKRYDGELLSVPESLPPAERLPSSFSAVKVEHEDTEMDAFQSESLPYTLFWLKAEDDNDGRFYSYDDEGGVFVPYFRSEWSSRFFTVTVLPENAVPDGFELTTLKVRGERVPAYRLLSGAFVPYEEYRSGYEELDVPLSTSGDDQDPNTTGVVEPSENSVEENDSEARQQRDAERYVFAAEGTDPEPAETENSRLNIPIPDPPKDTVLLVCRVNDSNKKTLFLYDTVYDSMISVGSWPVPVWGSYLERSEPPAPSVTEKPTEETDEMKVPIAPVETAASEPRLVALFGLLLPPWVLIVSVVVLLLLLLALVFTIKSLRARRRHSFTYEEDDDYDANDDEDENGVLYIKGLRREYVAKKLDPQSDDIDVSSSWADHNEYEEDVLTDYPEDEWIKGPNLIADLDADSSDGDDVVIAESSIADDLDGYPDKEDYSFMAESSLTDDYLAQELHDETQDAAHDMAERDDQDFYIDDEKPLSAQFCSDEHDAHFAENDIEDVFEEPFDDQDAFGDDEEPADEYVDQDAPSVSVDHRNMREVDFPSDASDITDDVPHEVPLIEDAHHVRRRPSPDAIRRFPNMRQVFLQNPSIRQPEPESDEHEPYSRRFEKDRMYFEEAYTDDDEI